MRPVESSGRSVLIGVVILGMLAGALILGSNVRSASGQGVSQQCFNVGGPAHSGTLTWDNDSGHVSPANAPINSTVQSIANATDEFVMQTARESTSLAFAVPVTSPVLVEVEFFFAELEAIDHGERVYSLAVDGQTVVQDFDVLAATGGRNKQATRSGVVLVEDGSVSVTTSMSAGAIEPPSLNGVCVTELSSPPPHCTAQIHEELDGQGPSRTLSGAGVHPDQHVIPGNPGRSRSCESAGHQPLPCRVDV